MSPPCRSTVFVRIPSALALFGALCACGAKRGPSPSVVVRTEWPSPMVDASPTCDDVGDLRVCWNVATSAGVVVVPRATPAVALSRLGFRCSGASAKRTCVDRTLGAEEFRCTGARCEERHPRLPDAGEWECADIAGAVFCRGGEPPAGAPPGASDPGFVCAPRLVKGAPPRHGAERLCVDWSPDFPEGHAAGYRCRFESTAGTTRICERDASVHSVGDACDHGHPCIDGLVCAGGRCVPARPEPSCWVDGDCDQKVCRFGTCTSESP